LQKGIGQQAFAYTQTGIEQNMVYSFPLFILADEGSGGMGLPSGTDAAAAIAAQNTGQRTI
jgi:hypothetical protein